MTRREAARVILRDERGRVLLLRGHDPDREGAASWWITPGGGLEPGESPEQAARRELREETGLALDRLEGPVFEHVISFAYTGEEFQQHEVFFTATVDAFSVSRDGWTDVEKRALSAARWWTAAELRSRSETVYPVNLVNLLG